MSQGYRSVSTRQIAEACGLTQPALYRHFPGKEQLYLEVLLQELDSTYGGLKEMAQNEGGIEAKLLSIARYMQRSPHDLSLMLHDIEHEIGPESRQCLQKAFYMKCVMPIADVFRGGMKSGELRTMQEQLSPETATFTFLGLLRQRRGGGALEAAQPAGLSAELVVDLMLRGLSL